jgi:hypothetical protein
MQTWGAVLGKPHIVKTTAYSLTATDGLRTHYPQRNKVIASNIGRHITSLIGLPAGFMIRQNISADISQSLNRAELTTRAVFSCRFFSYPN